MRRVAVLALGGTIACVQTKRGLVPQLTAEQVVKRVRLPQGVQVDATDLMARTIVYPPDWQVLAKAIFSGADRYDGFVVTLGTDSLAYVAAALSLMLPHPAQPVVLTGAMRPPHQDDTDASTNLEDAIAVALTGAGAVMVVFDKMVHDGAAVSKMHTDQLGAFVSPRAPCLGAVRDGIVQWRTRPTTSRLSPGLRPQIDLRVSMFTTCPQTQPLDLEPLSRYRGLLVQGYGDGNVADELVPALVALARQRLLVLASQCPFGEVHHHYAGGKALIEGGCLSARAMTHELALVKLMWVLGNTDNLGDARRLYDSRRATPGATG